MSPFAIWLDTVFASFDYSILEFWHTVAQSTGAVMTPAMKLISLTGESGIGMILLGLALVLFKKTRKAGFCVLGAVICGAIITNVTLKPLIARARPYDSELYPIFRQWWADVGSETVSDLSFPSGHATATTAAMAGLSLISGKKYLGICIPYVVLMCASRNYLMVHYPSDVIAGVIAGTVGAVAAFFITKLIFKLLENHASRKFSAFILDFDITNLFRSKKQ